MTQEAVESRAAFAENLIREVGALALGYFNDRGNLSITDKGTQDQTTQADMETEQLIRSRLATAFPDDVFLGEETGGIDPAPGQGIWVVDPIDGTACFIAGMPGWTVSVAWVLDDDIQIGLVFDPVQNDLYAARRGAGATMNGTPIHCGPDTDFSRCLTGISSSHRRPAGQTAEPIRKLIEAGGMFHRIGSCALSLAYVACDKLNGYYEAHINAWDCHAGLLLVTEAGGWINNQFTGADMRTGGEIAACAPGLKGPMQSLMIDPPG